MAKFLGELLVEKHLITMDQLERALQIQEEEDASLGCILVEQKLIVDVALADLISSHFGIPQVGLRELSLATAEAVATLSPLLMNRYKVFPLGLLPNGLKVAMVDPTDKEVTQIIYMRAKQEVLPVVAPYHLITGCIRQRYKLPGDPIKGEAMKSTEAPAPDSRSVDGKPGRQLKILYAVTDATEGKNLSRTLARSCAVRITVSPKELFAATEREEFDLLMLDSAFCPADQRQIVSILKGEHRGEAPAYVANPPRINYPPVVFLGKESKNADGQPATLAGCEVLGKPLNLTDIKLVLSRLTTMQGGMIGAHGKKVLIADDMQTMRMMIKSFLKPSGYEVLEANNGEEVLEVLARTTVDLILLDCLMPVMDGITCCKKLKDNSATKDIPIIILTSKDNYKMVVDALSAGCNAYVPKPLDETKLLTKVRFYLSR